MPGGYVSADAAGAVLPNGDLLLAGSPPASGGNTFPSPTKIFELNPLTNVYMDVTPSSAIDNSLAGEGSFTTTFMVLPTGQIAVLSDNSVIAVYTESGSPVAAAVPVITGISFSGTTGVYTLSGTNLNGINDGAAYGDDNEMASNYPLVRLTDSSGNITYARTTNWSLTGVFQGAETVTFTLPAADTTGAYLLQSVANGVPSATALAVLVNANTTPTVTIQSDANPANVDVVGSGTIQETFPVSSFSSIYFVGDNNGDTLSVKLTNSDGSIVTNIQAGTATDTINVNQTSSTGPVVIDPSTGTDAVNVGTAGAGTAIAQFLASQQIGLLTVGNGGSVTVSSTGTKKLLQINGLVTSGTGVLDLTDNYMIVHGGNLATLIPQLFSGLNLAAAGYWNGPGIISSTAAADTTHTTALGIILNNINGNTLYGSGAPLGLFEGQNPSLNRCPDQVHLLRRHQSRRSRRWLRLQQYRLRLHDQSHRLVQRRFQLRQHRQRLGLHPDRQRFQHPGCQHRRRDCQPGRRPNQNNSQPTAHFHPHFQQPAHRRRLDPAETPRPAPDNRHSRLTVRPVPPAAPLNERR